MNPDKLFIRSLDDLHLSINSGDEYEVLRAAGILRQLFLDGSASLVDQVNRNHRLQLLFQVIPPGFPHIAGFPEPDIWSAVDSIDPRLSSKMNTATNFKRDPFLGLRLGRVHGQDYSVADIIKFAANIAGGVHAGSPKDATSQNLEKLQEVYVFSELSIPLQHLRSIGRVVLEALRPLRDRVLNLTRFQDAPGLSFHMVLTLLPEETGQDLFILDVGIEEKRDRLSIYLDTRQELCFRLIDCSGHSHIVRAGSHDCAYKYGSPSYLTFQIAFGEDGVLLHLDVGGWSMVNIFAKEQITLGPDKLFFVLGSDVTGHAKTHMSVMEWCVYSRHLKEQESEKLRSYFEDRIRQGYKGSVYFKGNQFLHSQDHPNFIKAKNAEQSAPADS